MFKKFLIAALFIMLVILDAFTYAHTVQKEIADNVVRLHVIANSDSLDDQELKLKVRDAVLIYMKEKNYATRNVAYNSLENSLDEIELIAKKTIEEYGYNYPVTAELGEFDFPKKDYDQFSFPSGKYTAVRIKIGESIGHNWWCVMYPSLCLNDDTTEGITQLQNTLSRESFSIISNNCEIKFKIIDWFN